MTAKKPTVKRSSGNKEEVKLKSTLPKKVRKTPADKAPRDKKSVSEVALPSNMSQRSIEKSLVLKREFDHYYRKAMRQIAYVTGICFLLVGSAAALSEVLPTPPGSVQINHSAQAISATPDPVITLQGTIPSQITSNIDVDFTATDADNVSVALRSSAGVVYDVPFTNTGSDTFTATIRPGSYPADYYSFFIYAAAAQLPSPIIYRTNLIQVGNIAPSATPAPTPTPSTNTDTSDTSTNTSTTNSSTGGSTGTISTQQPNSDTATFTQVDSPVTDFPTDTAIETPFALFTPYDAILTGTEVVGVSHPDSYAYIELYARRINSVNSTFVTLATKRSTNWQFVVHSENLPNGDYEFYATTQFNGESLTSESLRLTVKNQVTAVETKPVYQQSQTPSTVDGTSSRDDDSSTYHERPLYVIEELDDSLPATSSVRLQSDVERETTDLFAKNKDEIKSLFDNYASAKQSGDEVLMEAAEGEIQKFREQLSDAALQDERLVDIADNIDERLVTRIDTIKNKINAFEDIRRERSNSNTAVDTDGDGISDLDEVSLYNTDPALPDSDGDGFNDGVEIVRGYDPTDATPETQVRFQSPKEMVGLTRGDVLEVLAVSPIRRLPDQDNETTEAISTEIRGVALPNSFVTLYIFSTPIIVTVKTDADGSFVYTFDKELEDGEHDVYVAVTDNAGEIVAQSNPFSFIKEAQAFTPVDAAEAEVVSNTSVSEPDGSAYNLVFGLAILAFGLILVMLGIGLRNKEEDDDDSTVTITESPAESDPNV